MSDLRKLAEAATPGPWDHADLGAVWGAGGWVLTDASEDDGKFIAACDPQTVIALLDERDRLRAALERIAAGTPAPSAIARDALEGAA